MTKSMADGKAEKTVKEWMMREEVWSEDGRRGRWWCWSKMGWWWHM